MQKHRVDRYSDLPAGAQIRHDFRSALMLLGAPLHLTNIRRMTTAHHRPPQQKVTSNELHQAFRYGIAVDLQDQVAGDLISIVEWIEDHL